MRASIVLALALIACKPMPDTTLKSGITWGIPTTPGVRGLPEALRLGVGHVVPGAPLVLRTQGAAPGERVVAVASARGLGEGACPAPLAGQCLGLASPFVLVGDAIADAGGLAEVRLTVPGHLAVGSTLAFQTVALRGAGGVDTVLSQPVERVAGDGSAEGVGALLPGDLVVTEVMTNPAAVSDANGEWFEVVNRAPMAVDLDGLELSDLDTNHFVVAGPLVVGPGGRVVFGASDDPAVNGGAAVDYRWSGFSLANGEDEIVITAAGLEIDAVAWDDGATFPDPDGAAMQLDPSAENAVDNDDGGAWCTAVLVFGEGDLGTPGLPNDLCGLPVDEPACDNGVLDGDEVDVDCGGSCAPCAGPPSERNEDFETADFGAFPWALDGATPWVIEAEPGACYAGESCMRSHPAHAGGDTSGAELELFVREDGQITFQARVETEPDEHFFRFYVNDELALEASGSLGWQHHEVDVEATGVGEPPTRFRWEYSRSDFVDPGHPPLTAVWVDEIDLPSWNSSAPTPTTLAPADGTWTAEVPTFVFLAEDPDADPVVMELQWSSTPDFAAPLTTGELLATELVPAMEEGTWFWRARAKDEVDFAWSAWTPTALITVSADAPVSEGWQQTGADALLLGTVTELEAHEGGVSTRAYVYDAWTPWDYIADTGDPMDHLFTPDPSRMADGATGTLTVEAHAQMGRPDWIDIFVEGALLVDDWNEEMCWSVGTKVLELEDVDLMAADGAVDVMVEPSRGLDPDHCSGSRSRAHLRVDSVGRPGALMSPPIHHAVFAEASGWGRVRWSGEGVAVRVLDADGLPLSDALVPGNSAGLPGHSVQLWHVDPVDHPVLRLGAELGSGAQLDSWSVVASEVWTWDFEQDGEAEGWEAGGAEPMPTAAVVGGAYVLDQALGSADPYMRYAFPAPVESDRFTTVEVEVRTSNLWVDDVPMLWWSSSYGDFDARRTLEHDPIYLLETQTLVFDLTAEPIAPAEAWRGTIEAVRLDLVDAFVDAVGAPEAGWWEVESIRMY
jgi:hypothetical protein